MIVRLRPWMVLLAAAVAATLAYTAAALLGSAGRLSLPLDDAFIFFQYARQLATGHGLSYNGSDPASGGVTSVATLLVDAVGYLIGFRGEAMVAFALLCGGAGLFLALWAAWRLTRRLGARHPMWAPLFLVLNGPLLWGLFAGMDLPLYVAALGWTFASWAEERERGPSRRRTLIWGALAAVSRPEGLVFAVVLTLLLALEARNLPVTQDGGKTPRLLLILPLAAGLMPAAFLWLFTGRPSPTSLAVKGVLGLPGIDAGTWLAGALEYFQSAMRQIFLGFEGEKPVRLQANNSSGVLFYLAPLTFLLYLLGALPGAAREDEDRRPGPHLLSLLTFAAAMIAASLVVPRSWHWHRYLMPGYLLILPFAALGLERLLGLGRAERWPQLDRLGLGAYLFLALPGTAYFLLAFAQNSADIAFQQRALAEWASAALPAGSRLGVNDAGAMRYYGRHPIIDLEGLVTPALTEDRRQGTATLYEALERMPAAGRPTHLVVYPNWYDAALLKPHRQIHQRRIFRQSIAGGNPMVVYEADWRLANSGDTLTTRSAREQVAGKRLVDRLDVADRVNEARHGYVFRGVEGQYQGVLELQPGEGGADLLDGGRVITREESFRVSGVTPGRDLTLVLRSRQGFRVRVAVDGEAAGDWIDPGRGPSNWTEGVLTVPGRLVRREAPRISVRVSEEHASGYMAFHYWFFQ